MAKINRSKNYTNWLDFVNKVKNSKAEFGNMHSEHRYTIGGVASYLESAILISAHSSGMMAKEAVTLFDEILDKFYSNSSILFKALYEDMAGAVSDEGAILALLIISSSADRAISRYRVNNNQSVFKISFDTLYKNVSSIDIDNVLMRDSSSRFYLEKPVKPILTENDLNTILGID